MSGKSIDDPSLIARINQSFHLNDGPAHLLTIRFGISVTRKTS